MTADKEPIKKRGSKKLTTKDRIDKLQKLIESLELELPDAPLRRAGSIERQVRLNREYLRIERIHLASKINQIRRYKVSGSYGSSTR
jgi:hypothetical protein